MEELDRERYDITEIPLNATMTDKPYAFDANILVVGQVPIEVLVRVNDVGSPQMNLQIFRQLNMRVKRLFVTTSSVSSTSLILFSSKEVTVGTQGFGSRAQLIDSVAAEYDARMIKEVSAWTRDAVIGATTEVDSGTITTTGYNKIVGFIFSDVNLGLTVQTSNDGTTWRDATTDTVTANTTYELSYEVSASYMRIQLNNATGGATTVTEVNLVLSTGA